MVFRIFVEKKPGLDNEARALLADGKLLTSGGRVLGVTAVADTLAKAVKEAYALADKVTFGNRYCRRDIGQRALSAK